MEWKKTPKNAKIQPGLAHMMISKSIKAQERETIDLGDSDSGGRYM